MLTKTWHSIKSRIIKLVFNLEKYSVYKKKMYPLLVAHKNHNQYDFEIYFMMTNNLFSVQWYYIQNISFLGDCTRVLKNC